MFKKSNINVNKLLEKMYTLNILTFFYFGIMYLTCYLQTYKIYIIVTIKIRSKIQ